MNGMLCTSKGPSRQPYYGYGAANNFYYQQQQPGFDPSVAASAAALEDDSLFSLEQDQLNYRTNCSLGALSYSDENLDNSHLRRNSRSHDGAKDSYCDNLNDDAMESPAVKAIISMGFYSRDVVEEAVHKLQREGTPVSTAILIDLVNAAKIDDGGYGSDGEKDEDEEDEDAQDTTDCGAAAAAAAERMDSGVELDAAETEHKQQPIINERVAALREENKRLKQINYCRKCKSSEVTTLFLPCRHLVCCESCANSVKDCPLCQEEIIGTVKTYLA